MKLKKFHKIIANTPEEIKEDVNLSMDILEQPIQTAIEWLIEQCPRIETIVAYHVLEQAKQMEKDQIINAYESYPALVMSAEEYYNQTYQPK